MNIYLNENSKSILSNIINANLSANPSKDTAVEYNNGLFTLIGVDNTLNITPYPYDAEDKDIMMMAKKFTITALLESKSQYTNGVRMVKAIFGKNDAKEYMHTTEGMLVAAHYGMLVHRVLDAKRNGTMGELPTEIDDILFTITAGHVDAETVGSVLRHNNSINGMMTAYVNGADITKAVYNVASVWETFIALVEYTIPSRYGRSLYTPRVPVGSTYSYAITGEVSEEDDQKVIKNPVLANIIAPDGTDGQLVSMVSTSWNRNTKIILDMYANDGVNVEMFGIGKKPSEVATPISINMSMEMSKKLRTKLIELRKSCNSDAKLYNRIDAMLNVANNMVAKDGYEDYIALSVIRYGFTYNGMHYQVKFPTASQIRAGQMTFMADPNNDGWNLTVKMWAELVGAKHKGTVDEIFEAIQKAMTGSFEDTNLSKLISRPGLGGSKTVSLRAITERDDSDFIQECADYLDNADVYVVCDDKGNVTDGDPVVVKADTKNLELSPLSNKMKSKDGKTFSAKLVHAKNTILKLTAADGGGLISVEAGIRISAIKGFITEEEYYFFKAEYKKFVSMANVGVKANEGNETARKLVDIFKKVKTTFQARARYEVIKGFNVKGAFTVYDIKNDEALKEIGHDMHDMIIPKSCVKYGLNNSRINMLDFEICAYNKGRDMDTHEVNVSAQHIGVLNMNATDAYALTSSCINDIRTGLDVGTDKDSSIRSLLELNISGAEKEITDINCACELVKANPKMRFDTRFTEYLRDKTSQQMKTLAGGKVTTTGDYLLSVCDPKGAILHWFAPQIRKVGVDVNNYKTLYQQAKEQGYTHDIYYVNGYEGEIAAMRSPAYSEYEPQRGQAVNVNEYWYMNDVIIFSTEEGLWRKLGGSDFDGDKILVLYDNTCTNKTIIESIPMTTEVNIDPKDIAKQCKISLNGAKLSENTFVDMMKQMSKKNKIGQIAKWASAQMALAKHLEETINIANAGNCTSITFVISDVPEYSWEKYLGRKDLDDAHFMLQDYLASGNTTDRMTYFRIVKNCPEWYVIKDDVLYVEGYIERYRNQMGDIVLSENKDHTYVGMYGTGYTVEMLKAKRDAFIAKNEVNSGAGSIEIDATGNGFHSNFHEKCNVMAAHELFRDVIKGKELNDIMLTSMYVSVGTLGAMFFATMEQWEDVDKLLSKDTEIDMSDYLCKLLPNGEADINGIMQNAMAIELIRNDYTKQRMEIMTVFGNEEDEDERNSSLRSLDWNTKQSLYSLVDKKDTTYPLTKYALAVVCYLAGNGSDFSHLFIDELREVLADDPTAIGIEKLPDWFDADTMTVDIVVENGKHWAMITSTKEVVRTVSYKKKNGKTGKKHITETEISEELFKVIKTNYEGAVTIDTQDAPVWAKLYDDKFGRWYIAYTRQASNSVAPNNRTIALSEQRKKNFCKPTTTLSIVLGNEMKMEDLYYGDPANKLALVKVRMAANGKVYVMWYNEANNKFDRKLGVKLDVVMRGLPKFLKAIVRGCMTNHVFALRLDNAVMDGNTLNNVGIVDVLQ